MHAKRPEGPALSGQRPPLPARAMSAQVKLASPVYPIYSVRRADRGPAPITRLIHLPATCRSIAGSRPPQLHHVIAHHVNLLSRLGRSRGHRVLQPGPELACGAGPTSRVGDVALRRPTRPAPRPGVPCGYHPRVPSLIQSGRSPARYRTGPRCAARDQRQRETPPSGPCRQIETPTPTRTGVIIAAEAEILPKGDDE